MHVGSCRDSDQPSKDPPATRPEGSRLSVQGIVEAHGWDIEGREIRDMVLAEEARTCLVVESQA